MPAAHRDFRSIWFFSLLAGLFMVVLLGAAWLIDQQHSH